MERLGDEALLMARRFELVAAIAEVQGWSVAIDGADVPLLQRAGSTALDLPDGWRRVELDLGDLGEYYAAEEIATRLEQFEQELVARHG